MIFRNKTSSSFFEDRYRERSDPWNFLQSDYEQHRFETIAAALSHKRYRRTLEPGCSIGTLTERLAQLSDEVIALDFSPTAVAHATERCKELHNVQFSCAALTADTSMEGFDLVLFSEIGYYFAPKQWRSLVNRLTGQMVSGTTVLASHWLGYTDEHRQSGDQVHEILREVDSLQLEHEERHDKLRLDRFVKR